MKIMYSVRSHKGNVRETNEDNFFADGVFLSDEYINMAFSIDAGAFSPIVLAVCDGMGGEENGEVASSTAVKMLSEAKLQCQNEINSAVRDYIEITNDEINALTKRSGTTLALAVISKKGAYCFNVGDSRIYLFKRGRFRQVTNDHTKGAEKVKGGIISAEKARQNDGGNKLTRCIGIGSYRSAEFYPLIKGKYRLLICSDGLYDMVSVDEIKKIISENKNSVDVADELLNIALNNGGKDNITVIVADVSHGLFSELF